MKNLKTLFIGLLVFLLTHSVSGQGWEQSINIPNVFVDTTSPYQVFMGELTIDRTTNGDYLVAPVIRTSDNFMIIDTAGNYSWHTIDTLPFSAENHLITTHDNHYISANSKGVSSINDLSISKIDSAGNMLWLVNHNNLSSSLNFFLLDLMQTNDNNIVLLFYEENTPLNFRLIKIDYNTGNILWDNTISYNNIVTTIGNYSYTKNLVELPNGDLAFSGTQWYSFNNNQTINFELFIVKANSNGNFITSSVYNFPNATSLIYSYLDVNANGELALVGVQDHSDSPLLIKIDSQLNEIWRTSISDMIDLGDVLIEDDGSVIVVGGSFFLVPGFNTQTRRTIKKYDSAGNSLWKRQHQSYDGSNIAYASYSSYQAIEAIGNGDYLLFSANNLNYPNSIISIVKVGHNGSIYNAAFEGNVYIDNNLNCSLDANEDTLQTSVLLQTVQGIDTTYHISDNNGYYYIPINSGTYELSAFPIGANWLSCPPQTVTLNTKDTISQDLGLRPISTCHDLKVSITTPVLVRCFSNTYTVSYQNVGTQNETGVYIEVELDNFLIVNSASIPYTQNGNIYTFFIGNLDIAETGNFTINTTVDCNAVLGQAHCVDATIFPNQICVLNSTTWNGATIITNAFCTPTDSVTFELINIGLGNMTQPRNYYVIEDQVLPYQGAYQLQQGQDTSFTFPANGYVYQIQAEQEITHPWGNNMPSAITYGCNNGNLITNALNQLSLNDNLNFQDVDCQVNVGSFDPNDKTGFPFGYGNPHFITKNDKIEYLIRFQNTGTYTAFNVVVEDTIDMTTLDLRTLQIQGSSHDYELEIKDGNILVFTFNNIMLPDSNANEPASHGFIRFKIGQKANNAIGTVIENSAAIYFDFNAPIITNTTFHTVGENFIQAFSTQPTEEKLVTVKIFPNPFSEQATFEIDTKIPYQNLTLTIYNIMGRAVKTVQANGDNRMILDRNGLTSGIYFYQIRSEGLVLDSGKLMVQ